MLSQSMVMALQATMKLGGDTTLINGQPTLARWAAAGIGHIQTFLNPNEWGKASYTVTFSSEVLLAPFNLTNDSLIFWEKAAWTGVVRKVDIDGTNDLIYKVSCLVVLSTEG